ncbi:MULTISPECIES: hypothetical protein [Planktothricoides]|uniref:Uncharacterized protein n=1 Tax=Planktothricoides raciborskii GIHE-MW2 TaxID=2792601 RepID=A0AAU8JH14_9CYAN|nr:MULTISPECIES: hypothetical protein [Planktothricoides]
MLQYITRDAEHIQGKLEKILRGKYEMNNLREAIDFPDVKAKKY